MATVAEQVQQLYIGLLGYSASKESADSLVGLNIFQAAAKVAANSDYTLGSLSREDAVTELYNRMFNRDPEASGLEYWTTGEGSTVPVEQLAFTFSDAALDSDVDALQNRTAVANAYAEAAGNNYSQAEAQSFLDGVDSDSSRAVAISEINSAFREASEVLTKGRDFIQGDSGDDLFLAYVGQNDEGAVSNALSTGDIIDGGNGTDTLEASLIQDGTVADGEALDVTPRISNVENIRIEALTDVTLDADHIEGEEHYASDSSDDDLVIQNIDIESTQITKDISFEMKDTEQFSDLEAYFDEQDLVARAAETTGSASVTIQVADGAQAAGTETPLVNMTFDISFVQDGTTYSFQDVESTDGTYAGLVLAIESALADSGLTNYTVELGQEFTRFETDNAEFDLNYTAFEITITDTNGSQFENINFAPQQKAGSPVAVLLAQSEVDAEEQVTSFVVEADVIVDNVGRGSNGGEIVIGSTSNSDSSTGVNTINVIVRESSVISDISSTNDALENITLTNDDGYQGDFVLANNDFDNGTDTDNVYGNVDQANLLKEGLNSITATNFAGDIVLGRDNDIVDLGTLSAGSVTGDVTYNAQLNDDDYVVATGSGNDTLDITLDDNQANAQIGTGTNDDNTSVIITTGAGNDTITLDEENDSREDIVATIDSGAGDDVITGNDVTVHVTAGSGDDVVYAENTGVKALVNIDTTGMYTSATAATQGAAASGAEELSFLDGRVVTVTITANGAAATGLANGFESEGIEIKASNGPLTTLADLNAAILEAINENDVLNKIVTAYVDENGNIAVQYLVDGAQLAGSVEVDITNPTAATSVSSSMVNAYRDLINNSSVAEATVLDLYNTDLSSTTPSTFDHEGTTVTFTTATPTATSPQGTFTIGDDVITFDLTGTAATDAAALAAALVEKGYYAGVVNTSPTVDVVNIVTDKETSYVGADTATTGAVVIANDQALDETDITTLQGTNSADNNSNVVDGSTGDDVIVLSSNVNSTDIVEWNGYDQGNDTIVHFVTTDDHLDFTSYLNGRVAADGSGGSVSDESLVALDRTEVGTLAFTANSINLVDFDAVAGVSATQTFETLTAAQLEAALEAAGASTVATVGLEGTDGVSVLIIQDAANAAGQITGDDEDLGTYKAFEITYANAAAGAGSGIDFEVKLIGSFDLDGATLVLGDLDIA